MWRSVLKRCLCAVALGLLYPAFHLYTLRDVSTDCAPIRNEDSAVYTPRTTVCNCSGFWDATEQVEGAVQACESNSDMETLVDMVAADTVAMTETPLPECHPILNHEYIPAKNETTSNWDAIKANLSMVRRGGSWRPLLCRSAQSLAVLIPYRNRLDNLKSFITHIHPFLQRQNTHYTVYLLEQAGTELFNRGALMNAGFLYAAALGSHDCYMTHDVDMLPTNEANLYRCQNNPVHFVTRAEQYGYRLPYPTYTGGVVAFSRSQYISINGYSNLYFGWGGEDDDLRIRIQAAALKVVRVAPSLGTYSSLKSGHHKEKPNNISVRKGLFATARKRYRDEGVTSLRHTVVTHQVTSLFTRVAVRLHQGAMEADYNRWRSGQDHKTRAARPSRVEPAERKARSPK